MDEQQEQLEYNQQMREEAMGTDYASWRSTSHWDNPGLHRAVQNVLREEEMITTYLAAVFNRLVDSEDNPYRTDEFFPDPQTGFTRDQAGLAVFMGHPMWRDLGYDALPDSYQARLDRAEAGDVTGVDILVSGLASMKHPDSRSVALAASMIDDYDPVFVAKRARMALKEKGMEDLTQTRQVTKEELSGIFVPLHEKLRDLGYDVPEMSAHFYNAQNELLAQKMGSPHRKYRQLIRELDRFIAAQEAGERGASTLYKTFIDSDDFRKYTRTGTNDTFAEDLRFTSGGQIAGNPF